VIKDSQSAEKSRPTARREEAVFLELSRTHDKLSRPFAALMKAEELSPPQYNVLRILRGATEGLACGEIGDRMISRDPDITRLLDRLEKRGLILRCRETKDRRMVMARITPEGLKILRRLDGPLQETHQRLLGHLGRQRLRELMDLLKLARQVEA
jgi:DNA-binding MarR family transcriptional regulator